MSVIERGPSEREPRRERHEERRQRRVDRECHLRNRAILAVGEHRIDEPDVEHDEGCEREHRGVEPDTL